MERRRQHLRDDFKRAKRERRGNLRVRKNLSPVQIRRYERNFERKAKA
jgi:hypothetical protein